MKKTLFLAFLLIAKIASAQVPEPQKNTYVNDFAQVLTGDQITALNQNIFNIEKKSGVQLTIVLVDKIPAQYDMEEFALLIGRKWHVGKHQDGIVYVAAISQHKQRFEIARALDNTFSNEKSQAILAAIKPYFKQKDYNGGLQQLINQVDLAVGTNAQTAQNPAPAVANPTVQTQPGDDPDGTPDFWIGLGAGVLVIVLIIYFIRRGRRNRMNDFNNNQAGGFGRGPMYPPGQGMGGSGVGSFVAGAAVGALAGYAASSLIDNMDNNQVQQPGNTPANDGSNADNSQADNTPDNWGNWGSGDDSSSGSDDSSSDSGFSGGDFSSDGGGGADW